MPKWGIKHYWNVTLSRSTIKITPATFGNEHYSPLYFHPFPSLSLYLPLSPSLSTTQSFSLLLRDRYGLTTWWLGFLRGGGSQQLPVISPLFLLFKYFPFRSVHDSPSPRKKSDEYKKTHKILPCNAWPFQKNTASVLTSRGILEVTRCNADVLHILTPLRHSWTFWGRSLFVVVFFVFFPKSKTRRAWSILRPV